MKKGVFVLVFMLSGMSLFAQSLIDIVKTGTPQDVETALLAGARIDERDENGWTALMWAAAHNMNPEVITLLLNAGSKINDITNYGQTALMWAAAYNKKCYRHIR